MNKLRTLREARGWSQAELARRAGLNASTVGLVETGRLRPYPSQITKLAHALGVRAKDLGAVPSPGDGGPEPTPREAA